MPTQVTEYTVSVRGNGVPTVPDGHLSDRGPGGSPPGREGIAQDEGTSPSDSRKISNKTTGSGVNAVAVEGMQTKGDEILKDDDEILIDDDIIRNKKSVDGNEVLAESKKREGVNKDVFRIKEISSCNNLNDLEQKSLVYFDSKAKEIKVTVCGDGLHDYGVENMSKDDEVEEDKFDDDSTYVDVDSSFDDNDVSATSREGAKLSESSVNDGVNFFATLKKEDARDWYIKCAYSRLTVDGLHTKNISVDKKTLILKCLLRHDKVVKARVAVKRLRTKAKEERKKLTSLCLDNSEEQRMLSRKRTLLKNLRKDDMNISGVPGNYHTLFRDHWAWFYRYEQVVKLKKDMHDDCLLNYKLFRVQKSLQNKYKVWIDGGAFEMEDMIGEVIAVEEAFDIMFEELSSGCVRNNDCDEEDPLSADDSSEISGISLSPLNITITQFSSFISEKYYSLTSDLAKVFFRSIRAAGLPQDDRRVSLLEHNANNVTDVQLYNKNAGILDDNDTATKASVENITLSECSHITDPDFIMMGHIINDPTGGHNASEKELNKCIIVMVHWKSREMRTGYFIGDSSNLSSMSSTVLVLMSNCIHVSNYLRNEKRNIGPLGILLDESFINLFITNERKSGTTIISSSQCHALDSRMVSLAPFIVLIQIFLYEMISNNFISCLRRYLLL